MSERDADAVEVGSDAPDKTADQGWTNSQVCPLQMERATRYSLRVLTTLSEIEDLRTTWTKWSQTFDTDIDYFLFSLAHDPSVVRPHVVAVYDGRVPQAILVGQIKKRKISEVVSFISLPGPNVRILEIKRDGRMGQPSPAVDQLFASELVRTARAGDVDLISFERLDLTSVLFHEIQRLEGVRARVLRAFHYSALFLKGGRGKGQRLFTGKIGREIRRKRSVIRRAFADEVAIQCFSQVSELDASIQDVMRIARVSWQGYLGSGFTDSTYAREMLRFFADHRWLRIYILYIRDVPCSFLIGELYDDTFYCRYAGYHPEYAPFSVGFVLTAHVFEELALAGIHRVDLGDGGQEHNRRWGSALSEQGHVQLYSTTLRGFSLNLFYGTTQIVRKGGQRMRSMLRLDRFHMACRRYVLWRWRSRELL